MRETGKEYPPDGESDAIAALAALHLQVHRRQPGPFMRGEHPKQHAGLWATFEIAEQMPDALRVGLFASPGRYTALVRFSNGRGQDDRQADVHGMAIKVLVPDQSGTPQAQDFIVADCPVFFARDVKHLLDFLTASVGGSLSTVLQNYPELARFTSVPAKSLTRMTFWSQTPYRLGEGAVKYVVTPSPGQQGPDIPLADSPDCLGAALVEQLSRRGVGASFDLSVQPQTDAETMPIEDPTVEWTSPPVRVATIGIGPQDFASADQAAFFASLSWTPWNALPAHLPLGGINRARRPIYAESVALRHSVVAIAADGQGNVPGGQSGR